MDISYCDKKCPIGNKASEELLAKHNSAFDAAIDFLEFVRDCSKTCPYSGSCDKF
jgi:hypothetical protein